MIEPGANQVVCPRCGRVRLETPPGTTILPTLGMAKKAAGVAGECDCGRAPHERPGAISHVPGEPSGPGGSDSVSAEPGSAATQSNGVSAEPGSAATQGAESDPAG